MTDLLKLAERVEAGEMPKGIAAKGDIFEDIYQTLYPTLDNKKEADWGWELRRALKNDSLDAAKALHEAVLPGWGWHIRQDDDGCYASCLYPVYCRVTPGSATAKTPAAAWVAAILRAKHAEGESDA